METETYHFKAGDCRCIAVSDGYHTYTPPVFPPPATLLFANASGESLEQALAEHNLSSEQWVEWRSPYICLIVNMGGKLLLADTGAGALAPTTGKLLENLQAEKITPEDIALAAGRLTFMFENVSSLFTQL